MIHCPGCGGELRFDIPSQHMVCGYCGGHYDPASTAEMSKDANGNQVMESYVFTCPSCGGELLTTDEKDMVGFCPFCGGASMLFDRVNREWAPEYVIPFQITKEQCKELYAKEAKRSFFTSRKYSDPQLIDSFRGIYMPYWCYRAIQQGSFRLEGQKKGFSMIKTYSITGDCDIKLDGYAHDAAKNFDDRISEEIAPFDPRGHKPFAPGYLSGFYADIGDVNAHDYEKQGSRCMSDDTAVKMADQKCVAKGAGSIGRIEVDRAASFVPTKITSAARTLYPVWFMSYRNKDKLTYAAVNGQTGKVTADLPLSPWRILIAVLVVGVIIALNNLFVMPAMKANAVLLMSVVLLIAGTILLRVSYRKTINREPSLRDTEEAKRFKKRDNIRLVLMIVTAAIGFVVFVMDLAYNLPTYLCCVGMAGMLFYIMLSHIRFQAEIARRQPPQFNKKGAASDEN